jgi:hypothetical protein
MAAVTLGAYCYGQRLSRLNTWELAFQSRTPRVTYVVENGESIPYTYVVYEVTNENAEQIDFYPTFKIETPNAKPVKAMRYPTVFAKINEALNDKAVSKINGALKPGESRRGIAIFRGADPAVDEFVIYATGLAGDFKKAPNEAGEYVTMCKTYKLAYKRPGDSYDANLDPIELDKAEWVWHE